MYMTLLEPKDGLCQVARYLHQLNNLRPDRPLTRDLFSRAGPASARKSLIFLDRISARVARYV